MFADFPLNKESHRALKVVLQRDAHIGWEAYGHFCSLLQYFRRNSDEEKFNVSSKSQKRFCWRLSAAS